MVKNPRLHLQIFPNKPIHWFKSIMDGLNPVDSENKLIHGEIPLTKKLRIVHASHRFPLLKIWQHPLHWWFFPFPPGIMKFCPSSLAKLVQISPIKPMVYGRYTELVFMGFINPRSHHWGAPSCGIIVLPKVRRGAVQDVSFRDRLQRCDPSGSQCSATCRRKHAQMALKYGQNKDSNLEVKSLYGGCMNLWT